MKVLFVCTGNTCRSPMAEGILREIAREKGLDIEVNSKGLAVFQNSGPAENSIKVMEEIGIDIKNHISKMLDKETVKNFDLILTMSRSHRDMIKIDSNNKDVWTLKEYVHGEDLDVEDPFGGNIEIYRRTRDEIVLLIEEMIKKWEK